MNKLYVNGFQCNIIGDPKKDKYGFLKVFLDNSENVGVKCSQHSIPSHLVDLENRAKFFTGGNSYEIK